MYANTAAAGRVRPEPARAGFEEFVAARSAHLLRTARLLTQDPELAEDLVQTVLGKCWAVWSRIDADDPGGYVHRVLVNTYTAWWRRRWNAERPTSELPQPADRSEQSSADERADLRSALRNLPRRQRSVVVLRFYLDLSIEETAELMGCTTGTVKSQTSKAMAKLRLDPALARETGEAR
jgi:RNA polymerase sigma-70 factor (sigma-E family)